MAVKTQSVINRINLLLNDPKFTTWSLIEYSEWLNEAASVIAQAVPTGESVKLKLLEGAQQDLSKINPRAIKLLDIMYNINPADQSVTGKTVRLVDASALEAVYRSWVAAPQSATVEEFAIRHNTQFEFIVYPPAAAGVEVQAMVSLRPESFAKVGQTGIVLENPDEVIPVPDIYEVALIEYVVFRAYSKSSDSQESAAKSDEHYKLFQAAVAIINSTMGR